VEYRFQHLSNADIGYNDPGIDSQMIHISYVWGLR
jgi:Lipid A 3-O-deacylase (PagL)